jgi:membrane protein
MTFKAKSSDEPISSLIHTRAASLGLVAALGFMPVVSLAASAGLSAWVKFFRDCSRQAPVGGPQHRRVPGHLHATVHSDLQGPARHGDTRARPGTGRICHSRSLHHRKVADRNLSRSGGASSRYGAAGALIVLMFCTYYSAQSFLFGAALTKAISDERAPAAH